MEAQAKPQRAATTLGSFDVRQAGRWAVRHGLANAVIQRGLRTGDPYARMCGDPRLRVDPYPFYDEVRAAGDVVPGRFAVLTARHRVAAELVRAPQLRSGLPEDLLPRPAQALLRWTADPRYLSGLDRPSLLVLNGAEHARLRRLVGGAFTARTIRALTGRVEAIAGELLEAMEADLGRPDGVAELVTAYAAALPVRVIAEILGVPAGMQPTFLTWVAPIVNLMEVGVGYSTFRRGERALAELNTWMLEHMRGLRREPGEDLLSLIVRASDHERCAGGPGLSDVDLMVTAAVLLAAGFETTVYLIGAGLIQLLAHPDQLRRLAAEPDGWGNAVEELLRFDPPSHFTYRHSATPTRIGGVPVRAGQFVIPLLAAANRDPAVFAEPNVFDVTRPNAREHLAFSAGPHFCLGAALARMEGEIALRRLFQRFPDLALAAPPVRRPTRAIRGYTSIPVRLNRATPRPSRPDPASVSAHPR